LRFWRDDWLRLARAVGAPVGWLAISDSAVNNPG
jgi:hypothetical protein